MLSKAVCLIAKLHDCQGLASHVKPFEGRTKADDIVSDAAFASLESKISDADEHVKRFCERSHLERVIASIN